MKCKGATFPHKFVRQTLAIKRNLFKMKMEFPKLCFSLAICIILQSETLVYGQSNRRCRTPIDNIGTCVSLKYCPEVPLFFQTLSQDQAFAYSRTLQRICGFRTTYDHYPIVCCTRPNYDEPNEPEIKYPPLTTFIPNPKPSPTTPRNDWDSEQIPDIETETEKSVNENSPRSFEKQPAEATCRTPRLENGFCKPLIDCLVLFEEIKATPANETLKLYLRASHKICNSVETEVCCPVADTPSTNMKAPVTQKPGNQGSIRLLTEAEGCGAQQHNLLKKVIGGQDSEIGEWPWIALLGYGSPSDTSPFRCGGTLITAQHVLTAAHCILKELSFVRLGEHDLSIIDETNFVDIYIEKAFRHEEYGSKHLRFDVAMLYLEKRVVFTNFIYPICLTMSPELRYKSYVSYSPFTAGWGRTSEQGKAANVLQHVQLRVFENKVCKEAYQSFGRRLPDNNFDASVVCAGDISGKKDTCRGDSGGPLMVPELHEGNTHYYLIGVVSHGIGCGRPNSPAIYSSTQYFLDWILEKIQKN